MHPLQGALGGDRAGTFPGLFGKKRGGNRRKTNFFSQMNVYAFKIGFTSRQAKSGICQQSSSEQNTAMIKNKEWWREAFWCAEARARTNVVFSRGTASIKESCWG